MGKIDMNVKYEFLAPTTTPASSNSNSIYFDQVLLRRLQEETSGSPLLEETSGSPVLLNTRTESRLTTEFQLGGRGSNSPFRFTTTASPAASTTFAVSNVVTTTSTTTIATTTSTTTTTTTPTTAASSSSAAAPQRRLSSTELLKLCFTQGIGCDFSQNEVYANPTTETSVTTTTTTTTTVRPSLSKTPSRGSNRK